MKNRLFTRDEYNQAYRYCLSLCNNEDDAFDLLQASFEKLLKRGLHGLDNPKLYLYRIIRNQYIDVCRRNRNWKWSEFKDDGGMSIVDKQLFDDILSTKEEVARLLQDVSPVERELLYLSAVEEYSVTEISEFSGTPRGTLLSKLHRLKKKIRGQLPSREVGETG